MISLSGLIAGSSAILVQAALIIPNLLYVCTVHCTAVSEAGVLYSTESDGSILPAADSEDTDSGLG